MKPLLAITSRTHRTGIPVGEAPACLACPNRFASIVVFFALLVLSAGCTQEKTLAELLHDAQQHRANHEFEAADIVVRTMLQRSPADPDLYFELGRVRLEAGDLPGAERELRKALEFDAPKAQVLPLLADALVEMERFQETLDQIQTEQDFSQVVVGHISLAHARALLGLGKLDDARTVLQRAAATHPAHSLVGMVHVAMGEGNLPDAERLLAQLAERHAGHAEGWVTRGNLRRAQGENVTAREAYMKGAQAEPANPVPLLSLALMAASEDDLKEAAKLLAQARKLRPSSPTVDFAEAFVAWRGGKHEQANAALQRLTRVIPQHLPGTLLSAMNNHARGLLALARNDYFAYLRKRPNDLAARKQLGRVLLQQGQPEVTLQLVQPALDLVPEDADLLGLAGEAHGQLGDIELAAQFFEQATALQPKDTRLRSVLAASQLALGQNEAAIASLRKALELKPDSVQTETMLVRALIARKDLDGALATAEALERRHPRNPAALTTTGAAFLARGDMGGARAAYERALAVDSSYFPAAAGLAQLELRANRPELAHRRFEAVLAKNPRNLDAMMALARLEVAANQIERSLRRLEGAKAMYPDSAAVRIQLAYALLKAHRYEDAYAAVRQARDLDPYDFGSVELLADVQIARGDFAGAVGTLTQLKSSPRALAAQLRLGSKLSANGERRMAIAVLQKAAQALPGRLDVKAALGKELLRENRNSEVLELASRMRAENPRSSEAYALEGYALLRRGRHMQAEAALTRAEDLPLSTTTVMLLHEARSAKAGRLADERPLTDWLSRNPHDEELRLYLAWIYLARADWRNAAAHYLEVLKTSPENLMALNNMALALNQLGDRRALAFAERAAALKPNEPTVIDTLGMVLLAQDRPLEALSHLRRAVSLDSKAPEIQYHLALAYLKSGNNEAAKTALEAAIALKKPFAERANAERALKELGP